MGDTRRHYLHVFLTSERWCIINHDWTAALELSAAGWCGSSLISFAPDTLRCLCESFYLFFVSVALLGATNQGWFKFDGVPRSQIDFLRECGKRMWSRMTLFLVVWPVSGMSEWRIQYAHSRIATDLHFRQINLLSWDQALIWNYSA